MNIGKYEIKLSQRTLRNWETAKDAARDVFTQPWNPVEIGLTLGAAVVTALFFVLPWLAD